MAVDKFWFWFLFVGVALFILGGALFSVNRDHEWYHWTLFGVGLALIIGGLIWSGVDNAKEKKAYGAKDILGDIGLENAAVVVPSESPC